MSLRQNFLDITKQIESVAERVGRDGGAIKLVAVSKTHTAETVSQAIEAGMSVFGENRVQEGEEKISVVGVDSAEWHLIGHLQKNKARKAVQFFDVIQTLDSVDLAKRLERICEEEKRASLSVLIQVDLAGELTKTGIAEDGIPSLIEYLQTCNYLKLKGLMIVPPYSANLEKVRPYFRRLREIRDKIRKNGGFGNSSGELSMGMSHDFEVAIEEGATIVRIGTAIFGAR
ncbi:MAG: YggS family pyridoxal phosphate-dependent enzyme [Pyrinomonadaceae bacterium]